MSDTVLTAIISAGAIVVAALITGWIELKKRRSKEDESEVKPSLPLVQINNSVTAPLFVPQQTGADANTEKKESRPSGGWSDLLEAQPVLESPIGSACEVTPILQRAIADQIDAVAPFLQESVKEKFVGLRVVWRARLESVSRYGETVTVSADISESRCFLECETTERVATRLINTPRGAEIEVDGTLDRVSSAYCRLKNCTVSPIAKQPA